MRSNITAIFKQMIVDWTSGSDGSGALHHHQTFVAIAPALLYMQEQI